LEAAIIQSAETCPTGSSCCHCTASKFWQQFFVQWLGCAYTEQTTKVWWSHWQDLPST